MLNKGFKIHRNHQNRFQFPRPENVPAGVYHSTIINIDEARTNSGLPAIEIQYDLLSKEEIHYYVRLRYPLNSFFYNQLCERLLDSGLPEGASFDEAIGLEETVELFYPGNYGSIRAFHSLDQNVQKVSSFAEILEEN